MLELPGYSIKENIYRGGNTVVYRAVRLKDYKPVILKLPAAERPELTVLARLKREYELLQTIQGEGIIQAITLESFHKSVILVLEDIGGVDLRSYWKEGPLDITLFLEMAINVAAILGNVHQNFIIHKDLNPSNIVINQETSQTQIIDFGIASQLTRENQSLVSPNALEGTLPYVSPEQTGRMNRSIDYRSDFYALGMTLYELLAGSPPFTYEDPLEQVHAHLAKIPKAIQEVAPETPETLARIITKLIAKSPEDRYQTVFGLTQDLKKCLWQWQTNGVIETFEIGEEDQSDHFCIPGKLYGRENEVDKLLRGFERVSQGHSSMMIISGYAGAGKSSLVREIQKPIVEKRGYFISGKFDQLKRDIPYASLIEAFGDLIHQILTESSKRVTSWREKLLSNLGSNGQLIVDVIPELEYIIGKQPRVADRPASEAQNRFQLVFKNFFKNFTSREHPLVVFLDDLHWADTASLTLLKLLLTDFDSRYLFIIGAYRANECRTSHPLTLTLEELRLLGATISRVNLPHLRLEDINELLSETMHCDQDTTLPLAQICLQKTGGNPLFLHQLLEDLHRDGLVKYNHDARIWEWSLKDIEEMHVSDNLLEFMVSKIRKLSPSAQQALKLASCIGNRFELNVLAMVNGLPPRDTSDHLWEALKEGLVLPLDETYKFPDNTGATRIHYRFLHDRVQQAAYSMISEEQKKTTHLHIGRLLYAAAQKNIEESIFDIVNQLNLGVSLIEKQPERDNLSRLNLLAGRRAKTASAYESALVYYKAGILLLDAGSWRTQHELTFALHLERAECQHLRGMPQEAEDSFQLIFHHVNTRLQKAQIYAIKILAETHLNRPLAAIDSGLKGLALFGIHFPTTSEDMAAVQETDVARINDFIGDRDIDSLIDLPVLQDADHMAIMYLLMNMTPPTYHVNHQLFDLVILEMVITSLEFGNAASSSFAYVNYGTFRIIRFDDFHTGYRFGQLALKLSGKFERTGLTYKVRYVFATFINHWINHIKTSMVWFKEAHYYAFESGDLLFASYVAHHYLDAMFFRGESLTEIGDFASRYLDFANKENMLDATLVVVLYKRLSACLRGLTDSPVSLCGADFDEDSFLNELESREVSYPLLYYYIHKCGLYLMNEQPMEALEMADMASTLVKSISGMLYYAEFHFYQSLAITGSWQLLSSGKKSHYSRILKKNRDKLKLWAAHCQGNFLHRYLLVKAESARIRGKRWEAMDLYEEAITVSRGFEFNRIEALSHELAAKFWIAERKQDFAHLHLVKAHYDYQLWGANTKAELLAGRYMGMDTSNAPTENQRHLEPSRTTTAGIDSFEYLDLNTVIKASQAISGNLVLDDLLIQMMKILLENAGAQRGCLILGDGEENNFRVEAEGDVDTGDIHVLHNLSVDQYRGLASSVLNYTLRTRDFVVLGDAAREGLFTTDPYIIENKPRSVLSLPIFNQTNLFGVLYLENNHTRGAFTAERLEVLRILAAQAAISIEKARLYARLEEINRNLESKVTERTNELELKNRELGAKHQALIRTQKQLILQEKMASLGMLTAGVAHEMRNPLNFINNFARISQELSRELRDLMSKQRGLLKSEALEDINDILHNFEQNTSLIERHGERAENIVKGMLKLSKGQSGVRRSVEINPLIEEYVKLAYNGLYVQGGIVEIQIERHFDPEAGELNLAAQDIGRAVLNMVNNACHALTEKARKDKDFEPKIHVRSRHLGHGVEITIRDNGPGINDQILDKIFNPFFTTRPANREHIGLGLSISYDIVRAHQGDIKVSSKLGVFTEFKILLPKS